MFNLTSETDEATEVIADLGNFVHPISDMVVSDVHQTATAAGDNGKFPSTFFVFPYISAVSHTLTAFFSGKFLERKFILFIT